MYLKLDDLAGRWLFEHGCIEPTLWEEEIRYNRKKKERIGVRKELRVCDKHPRSELESSAATITDPKSATIRESAMLLVRRMFKFVRSRNYDIWCGAERKFKCGPDRPVYPKSPLYPW